jgi:putative transposase
MVIGSVVVSDRRACRLVGLARSTSHYRPRRADESNLIAKMRELADEWRGSGYRTITDQLLAAGWVVNKKRVERVWREQAMGKAGRVRRLRVASTQPRLLPAADAVNQRWALDFVADRLSDGKPYRMLAVIDVYSRECLALVAAQSLPASKVIKILELIASTRGLPDMITTDNGPEFISKELERWCAVNQVEHWRSRPGTPTDNPFIESFNARLRSECGDLWWNDTISEAQAALTAWRHRYNQKRGHSSLGRRTPESFAKDSRWVSFRALSLSQGWESQSQKLKSKSNSPQPTSAGRISTRPTSTQTVP